MECTCTFRGDVVFKSADREPLLKEYALLSDQSQALLFGEASDILRCGNIAEAQKLRVADRDKARLRTATQDSAQPQMSSPATYSFSHKLPRRVAVLSDVVLRCSIVKATSRQL